MKNKSRSTKPRQPGQETIPAWVAAASLGLFVEVYLAAAVTIVLDPQTVRLEALVKLLMALVPLVSVAMQWYLRSRDK